jgi:hypothetical protein
VSDVLVPDLVQVGGTLAVAAKCRRFACRSFERGYDVGEVVLRRRARRNSLACKERAGR